MFAFGSQRGLYAMLRCVGTNPMFAIPVAGVLFGSVVAGAASALADPGPAVGQSCSDLGQDSGSNATGPLLCDPGTHQWTPEPPLDVPRSQTLGDACVYPAGTTTRAQDVSSGRYYLAMCYQGVWTHYRP